MPGYSGAVMSAVYLDWAATSPISREAADYYRDISLSIIGNPSSIHRWGDEAKRLLDDSRKTCASILGCAPENVRFTSGGSESNNLVVTSLLHRKKPGHAVFSAVEHSSIYEPSRLLERFGWSVTRVSADKSGRLDPEKFAAEVRDDTAFAAVMLVNNETGAIQPLREIVEAVRGRSRGRILFHTDAVQAVGKMPVDFGALGVDSLSASAHKFQGPRGVGILAVKAPVEPLYTGGGQEGNLRPGTENVVGIATAAFALKRAADRMDDGFARARRIMDILFESVSPCGQCHVLPEARVSHPEWFSPFIASLSFPPIPGEVLVRVMNDRGYGISTGSACSSRKKRDTRVLEGMGVSKGMAFSSLRVSIGPETTEEDMERFAAELLDEIKLLFKVTR